KQPQKHKRITLLYCEDYNGDPIRYCLLITLCSAENSKGHFKLIINTSFHLVKLSLNDNQVYFPLSTFFLYTILLSKLYEIFVIINNYIIAHILILLFYIYFFINK